MKKMIFKTGLVLMICTLLLNLFAGCNNSTDLEKELMEKTTEHTIPENSGEEVTLTFMVPDTEKENAKEVLEQVSKASGLNIKLEFKWLGGFFFEKMTSAFAAGEKYDAFYVGDAGMDIPFNYLKMAERGELKDLTDLLPQYAPHIMEQLSDVELEGAKFRGKIIAVPGLSPQAPCLGVSVRKDLMDKYHLAAIKTFQDYEKFMETVKKSEPNLVPGAVGGFDMKMFANAFGYVNLDENLNLVYQWNDPKMTVLPFERTPEFREIAGLISNWHSKGYLLKANDNTHTELASFMTNSTYMGEGITSLNMNLGAVSAHNVDYMNYTLYTNQKIQRSSPIGNILENGAIAFNSHSRNVERALMFLNLLQSDPKLHALFLYGLEGREYTLVNDRVKIARVTSSNVEPYAAWNSRPFRNLSMDKVFAGQTFPQGYESDYQDFLATRTYYAPHEGFRPDYGQLQPESQSRSAMLRDSVWGPLNTGNFDPGKMNELLEKLNNSGTDKILKEVQRQLDQWRKEYKR